MMSDLRRRIDFCLVLLAALCLLAVEDAWPARPYRPVYLDPLLEPWRWRSFPELKGLGLRCLAEAGDGSMWFGTDTGVRRYDGMGWTIYTQQDGLLGAPVDVLCAVRDGSIYAATEMGISRFGGVAWRHVFPPEGDRTWPINDVMEASDGSIWAGTAWGAVHLKEAEATLYTSEEMGRVLRELAPAVRVLIVPDAVVPARPWSAPWGEGIGARVVEGEGIGLRRGNAPKTIWTLAPDGPAMVAGLKVGDEIASLNGSQPILFNDALFGPADVSVTLTVQRKGIAHPFDVAVSRRRMEGHSHEFSVADVYQDRTGRMWFGLEGGEVVCWDAAQGGGRSDAWRVFAAEDGLDVGRSPQIVQTVDGSVWVASHYGVKGVSRFDGKRWTSLRLSRLGGSDINTAIRETSDGTLWVGGNSLCAFQNGAWRVYNSPEMPIPSHRTRLLEASDGALWVAGLGQEVVRLDFMTPRWTTYRDLNFQCETPNGAAWFVTQDSGVVRCDRVGKQSGKPEAGASQSPGAEAWTRYGIEDGLMDAPVSLITTREGGLWASGSHNGNLAVAQFDGARWSLQINPSFFRSINRNGIYESSDGALWLSTRGWGVFRYRPSIQAEEEKDAWTHYSPPEVPNSAYGIGQSADGSLWIGGTSLCRFDGQRWARISDPVELSTSFSSEVCATRNGDLWVGTRTYGVFHYDGKAWRRHSVLDKLADNDIKDILQTADGSVWVATAKGVSRFDGQSWTTHALPPELPPVGLGGLREGRDGAIWLNYYSDGGYRHAMPNVSTGEHASFGLWAIRYQPDVAPPETEITFSMRHASQPGNVPLTWKGIDLWNTTPDAELLYAYRLDGGKWAPFSPQINTVLLSLSRGDHTFEVKARDRDFNEDPTPAVAHFTVVPPVWWQPWFVGMIVIFVGMTGTLVSRIVVRTRERNRATEALLVEAEKELQTAHDMQMGLMPTVHPRIEGFDIAGRCIPANQVGGDFFQYFHRNGRLSLTVADVTGHAMEAAIPAVMFSGILEIHMEDNHFLEEQFAKLNRSLHRTLQRRTFVCCTMGELDPSTRILRFANGGCPYPYHYVAATGDILELQLNAYPLGVRADTIYEVLETQLQPGDRIVFCSDGIIEADNVKGEQFGFERTAETIRQKCLENLNAEAIIDRILEAVAEFKGDAPQSDDMTCVVMRVQNADEYPPG